MNQKLMYAFRGWIGFVAFMDIGTAIRCFNEKRSFFGAYSYSKAIDTNFNRIDDPTLPPNFGILLHIESSITMSLHTVHPLQACRQFGNLFIEPGIDNVHHRSLTLIGLLILPKQIWEPLVVDEDENIELLKQVSAIKRRRHIKKET
ncbi:hypothetical protein RUM43_013849 [Polyplax serrata]|uniref:Uncharacterized protein n=1 Tax=Polyplax serrata TaxID=468196 RepID=A0AAN8P4R3_POLSC